MAVGHRVQRTENDAFSGALSSSTMMVTITAKTASEYAASRAVSFCIALLRVSEMFAKSGRKSERIFHEHGDVPEGGCGCHRRFLLRSWSKGRVNDPFVARLSYRWAHVPRSYSATRGPISPRRSRSARFWKVRYAGARHFHLHVREYRERHRSVHRDNGSPSFRDVRLRLWRTGGLSPCCSASGSH